MAALGIMLGCVGLDPINTKPRLTFGQMSLMDGVGLVPVLMGLFGISEVLLNIEQAVMRDTVATEIKGIFPTAKDWAESKWALIRGTVIGFFLGIVPGGGGIIASFFTYALEKRISKHPERFGKGAIEGVAAPEAANNAAAGGAFIPLMTLGIPTNAAIALLLGAFMIHGVQPGPLLMTQHPGMFWGVVASMYIGNLMLLVLNLPLIGLWVKVLRVPYKILFPLILLFCLIGVYSISNAVFDIYVMILFGVLGYLMNKFGYEPAPLVLAFVLGPMMETSLRKSLILSRGDFSIFFVRPLSAVFLILALLILVTPMIPGIGKKRNRLPKEDVS
jgi:putative tricarboxylic transport membrane protein